MTLPIFSSTEDPGPSFFSLLQKVGIHQNASEKIVDNDSIAHGTTIVAIRYKGGVLMAGDRRATSGHLISHRTMEKVFPADAFSGVGISGAAGPAMEMVRLFQLPVSYTHLTLPTKA